MKMKTDYIPAPDGPPMQVTQCYRSAEEGGGMTMNRPRDPMQDMYEDCQYKLAEGFDLKKLPRAEVERLLPGWTYSIDNRPGNGSWHLGSSQGYGNFSYYTHFKEVERALLSRLLYPETIKIILRGDPGALLGRPHGPIPYGLREIAGVSHDLGELPIHPEADGASRPIYIGITSF